MPLSRLLGVVGLPTLWVFLHYVAGVPELYLPSPVAVVESLLGLREDLLLHTLVTSALILGGLLSGVVVGVLLGVSCYNRMRVTNSLIPTIQSVRSIPPIATIPFFLLWFGFAWYGKVILITFGVALNICMATIETLNSADFKYVVAFRSFGSRPEKHVLRFCVPFALGNLLPTIRFALSTTIGLVIVAELLGSQVGIGHLIQSARSTFSMDVVFGCILLLGILNFVFDRMIVIGHRRVFPWKFRQDTS